MSGREKGGESLPVLGPAGWFMNDWKRDPAAEAILMDVLCAAS